MISALVLVIGLVIGTINGLAVVYSRVPDIVATLALSFVWAGVALIVLPTPGGGSPVEFQDLSTQATLSEWIPNGLLVLAGVVPASSGCRCARGGSGWRCTRSAATSRPPGSAA